MDAYSVWWAHGETLSNNVDPWFAASDVASSSNIEEHGNAEDDFHHMVYDAFCPSENDRHRNEIEFASENVGDAPNNNAQSFYDLLRASTIPLGPASNNQTLLGWLSYMLHTKAKNNISGVGYNEIIHGCRKLLSPEDQQKVPSNFYEAKKFMKSLGLGYVKIDACVNNCFLYYGDEAKSLTACPVCGEPRYKRRNSAQTGKKDRPRNSSWYLPIIPRLQRLYMSRKTAEHMTWHLKCCVDSEILIHPAQSNAWKHFDAVHPSFAADPRNVRVGLATDGFNPWGHSSRSYSWVETFDSFRKQNFTMRAMLMWTITDFLSYGMVSGWSTHGRQSCPYCMEMTRAFYLQNGRKISFFDCHRQFLPASHSYKMDTTHFLKGRFEFGPPPPRLDGHSVRLQVATLPDVLFGNPSVNQTILGFDETHNWVKRSIFWELPYWEDNLIRHNLDVMHCEKNFFDNIIHTVMDDSSSKDNVKSRMDLPLYCDREELHLYYDHGFASNIAHCVNLAELRLVGLKSHDCHIFMQRLIPIAFRGLLPDSIWGPLTETRCLTAQEMKAAELYVLLNCREVDALLRMSGRPINSARSRTTSGRRGRHDAVDLARDVTPVMNAGHTQSISPQGSIHVAAASSSQKQKGRGPNKSKKAARRPDERPFIQISHKSTFLDVEVPRLITTLWKRVYDGDYFTYELFPEHKRVQVWELFKTHYQWPVEDEDAIRKAFLRSMKKGWGDNMKDERDKWRTNGEYRPVWVPEHLWLTLCTYWDSDEFHILSERGKKNRASGERVSDTTGSVSFDVHEERMDTYVSECSATYGSDSASWPPRDNDAWAVVVGGCHSNFMPGIGSHVNPEELGFTYRKRQPKGNSYMSLMLSDMAEKQAKDREAMQMMRDEIGQVKEQREAMQRMMEEIGRMQASLSQQFTAFSAYGMRLPSATPSLPHTGQAFPPIRTSFPTVGPSFHASGPSFPHAMPMQLPIEPAFPMGQMGRQSEAPNTSSPNPPQDEFGYQPRFDTDYQGPFGPE
ncbi:hypothetical protein SLEP1_g54870 [Rubroshorea leprosula]|uniref:Transposase n=1 Tax=Rubroshorea leprosula TaxID=152421 RepID=A0AAV5MDX1_9ROSI|nr:hypothetical protein SLEP1_g54870 [Rubroshorea leprosula]